MSRLTYQIQDVLTPRQYALLKGRVYVDLAVDITPLIKGLTTALSVFSKAVPIAAEQFNNLAVVQALATPHWHHHIRSTP